MGASGGKDAGRPAGGAPPVSHADLQAIRSKLDAQHQLLVDLAKAGQLRSSLSFARPGTPAGVGIANQLFALVIAGDIGGTNSRLQLYRVPARAVVEAQKRAPGESVYERKYKNDDYASFAECMEQFLRDAQGAVGERVAVAGNVSACCLAVAGPVANNTVVFTNRASWTIDGALLSDRLRIPRVRLINDFVAQGYGVLTIDEATECEALQPAAPTPGAPKVCIGPGTGLGECFLTAPGPDAAYDVFPSEGAHAEFAPRVDPAAPAEEGQLEFRLLQHLIAKFSQRKRISVERVVSGPGLSNVYDFLAATYPGKVDPAVQAAYDAAGEKGQVVSENAGTPDEPKDYLCHMTMRIFAGAYGSEVGVAGLKWMPFGGIYLVGGITPKNMPWVRGASGPFLTAFHDKGRVAPLLKGVPVYAVLADDIGERGAHLAAVQLLSGLDVAQVPGNASFAPPVRDPSGRPYLRSADDDAVAAAPPCQAPTPDMERAQTVAQDIRVDVTA